MIDMLEPRVEQHFNAKHPTHKRDDPNANIKRLQKRVKKEVRGTVKELRQDARFIAGYAENFKYYLILNFSESKLVSAVETTKSVKRRQPGFWLLYKLRNQNIRSARARNSSYLFSVVVQPVRLLLLFVELPS